MINMATTTAEYGSRIAILIMTVKYYEELNQDQDAGFSSLYTALGQFPFAVYALLNFYTFAIVCCCA